MNGKMEIEDMVVKL